MLKLIRSELEYNRFMLLIFISIVPLVFLFEISLEDLPRYFIYLLLFLLQFYYLIFISKENRQIRFAMLPVKQEILGYFRLLFLISLNIIILVFYLFLGILYSAFPNIEYSLNSLGILVYLAVNLILFSVFFIFRDSIYDFLRSNRFFSMNKETGKNIMIFIALLINILGVYVNISKPKTVVTILAFIFELKPDIYDASILVFAAACLILLSGYSYRKRKSYLDI